MKESDDDAGVVPAVEGARDMDDVEDEEGVELFGKLDRTGLRNVAVDWVGDLVDVSIAPSSSSPSDSSSSDSISRPFGYSAHDVCTWFKVIGLRFSKLAARVSKQ